MLEGQLLLGSAHLKQSNFAIELKNFEKGTKTLEKKSFLYNLGLLFSAREIFLNIFKSRLFPIKNLDKIAICEPTEPATELEVATESTRKPATEATPAKQQKSKSKLQQEFMNEIIANKNEIFSKYFKYQNPSFLVKEID